jgi:hypothetical protein
VRERERNKEVKKKQEIMEGKRKHNISTKDNCCIQRYNCKCMFQYLRL